MNGTQDRETLEQRLRYTLHSLAGTVTEEQFATTTQPTTARKSHRRGRRIAVGLGVIAVPIVLAASAYLNEGPEYVKAIPPERVVMTGSVDGSRYLLVETDRTDECGHPVTGVELVEERKNLIGSEWNTSGYEYGEHTDTRTETGRHRHRYRNRRRNRNRLRRPRQRHLPLPQEPGAPCRRGERGRQLVRLGLRRPPRC